MLGGGGCQNSEKNGYVVCVWPHRILIIPAIAYINCLVRGPDFHFVKTDKKSNIRLLQKFKNQIQDRLLLKGLRRYSRVYGM